MRLRSSVGAVVLGGIVLYLWWHWQHSSAAPAAAAAVPVVGATTTAPVPATQNQAAAKYTDSQKYAAN